MKQIGTFALLIITNIALSQGINYSYHYDENSEFNLEFKTVYNEFTTDILLKISTPDSITNYEGILDFRSNYSDNKPDSTASIILTNAENHGSYWRIDLSFPVIKERRLLLIQFVHKESGKSYYYDIPLYWHSKINQTSTIIYDSSLQHPVFSNYLNTNTYYKTDLTEIVSFYSFKFDEASPPMTIDKNSENESFQVDSTFKIQANNTFQLKKEGLYFFEIDSANYHGQAYQIRDTPFPKYASIGNLIPPLRYITTNAEFDELRTTPNKATFEKVWLEITDDADRAKEIIMKYYRRVELANKFFSTFKEGWKTDMGMIYIVFGAPNEVYKHNNKEIWIYTGTKQQPKTTFTFQKINNLFSDKHFVLERKKEYKAVYMNRVDSWRKNRVK